MLNNYIFFSFPFKLEEINLFTPEEISGTAQHVWCHLLQAKLKLKVLLFRICFKFIFIVHIFTHASILRNLNCFICFNVKKRGERHLM